MEEIIGNIIGILFIIFDFNVNYFLFFIGLIVLWKLFYFNSIFVEYCYFEY